jgi:hypothetical protein
VQVLLDGPAPLHALALGEVTKAEVKRLLSAIPDSSRFANVWDMDRKVVILYDTAKLRGVREEQLRAYVVGKNLGAGVHAEFEAGKSALHLVAAHWPSHMIPTDVQRAACGHLLQSWLRELANESTECPALVVIGDFNDEPFAASLTAGLQGTRDRGAVRANADLFYNPFWRCLGEHRPFEEDTPIRGAGTYFSKMMPQSRWYTYDQALVSSALLQGRGWTLVERGTGVVPMEQLVSVEGTPVEEFDHLPIVLTLEHKRHVEKR